MSKSVKQITPDQTERAVLSAAHSLLTEGFDVSGEDQEFVRLFLSGDRTERQFHEAVKAKYDV
ncbi:hypothetical protein [Indiicoccus explosivorum]|uniref:hypothetical protein n=1 Tax=Indiicoccus explosivorum TaxID=1917864 RepID=UPI000B455144|nr:hypothetical protein [Indiicoccus explosivorum]